MKKALFALAAVVVTATTIAQAGATPIDCRKNCSCVISPSLICPPSTAVPAALAPAQVQADAGK